MYTHGRCFIVFILLSLFNRPVSMAANCNSILKLAANNVEMQSLIASEWVKEILADPEMPYYAKNLTSALKGSRNRDTFIQNLKAVLINKVPSNSIKARVAVLSALPTSKQDLLWALGEMNLRETQELTYGPDLANPSQESLLGQYMKETGAKILLRSFAMKPPINDQKTLQGPQRMVVAVSEESFAAYQKYFYNHNFMTVFGHAQVMQNGKIFSYDKDGVAFRLPGSENTALPQVVLTTTEAQRLEQYSKLFKAPYWQTWAHGDASFVGMYPWSIPGYCSPGGYTINCTQFIGNIPLGDKRVNAFHFPPDFESQNNLTAIRSEVSDYKHKSALVKRVWKSPANEQFAEMIGQGDANINAEFANPGWVISTLIGPTTSERVPLLFIVVSDHRLPIPQGLVPQFEYPM